MTRKEACELQRALFPGERVIADARGEEYILPPPDLLMICQSVRHAMNGHGDAWPEDAICDTHAMLCARLQTWEPHVWEEETRAEADSTAPQSFRALDVDLDRCVRQTVYTTVRLIEEFARTWTNTKLPVYNTERYTIGIDPAAPEEVLITPTPELKPKDFNGSTGVSSPVIKINSGSGH